MIFFHSLKVTSEAEINNYDTSVDGSSLSHHDIF
jgi:carboxypeptidase C (cathepsin A)